MPTNTVEKTIEEAQAAMTVKRAFGEPFNVGELTILPAARVGGGGAGGGAHGTSAGWGTGFGLMAQPMGVYVIDHTDAHWVPVSPPNPILGLVAAPINAVRTLVFGGRPWENALGHIFAGPPPRKRAHRTATRKRTHRRVA